MKHILLNEFFHERSGLSKKYRSTQSNHPANFADLVTFLGQQIPSWGVWVVIKIKISCKEAGSVQYKAHHMRAPPHSPQQIRCKADCAPQTVI